MKPFPSESDPAGQDERWIEVEALPPKENRRTVRCTPFLNPSPSLLQNASHIV